MLVGNIRKILRETENKVKDITKDATLENPIKSDILISVRANAYDEILMEYKSFLKKKKEAKEAQ